MLALSHLLSPPMRTHRPTVLPIRAPIITAALSAEARMERRRIAFYMQQIRQSGSTPEPGEEECAHCLKLMADMREEGLPLVADMHNAAMRMCAHDLGAVESVFAPLAAANLETEASMAALIEALVAHGELERATTMLESLLESGDAHQPRLRTCGPLITRLCDADNEASATALWQRLSERGVEFTTVEYAARLRMYGRVGGAPQLRALLDDALERFPRPDADFLAVIEQAVRDVATTASSSSSAAEQCVQRGVPDEEGKLFGTQLRVLALADADRQRVREVLMERAATRGERGVRHMQSYAKWLQRRPPFDYVLDGPNIAYNKQNHAAGAFSYAQIDAVVDALVAKDPTIRVLLLLPSKYLKAEIPNHTSSAARSTILSEEDVRRIKRWRERDMLYECAGGLYDDWFWIYATVAEGGDGGARTIAETTDEEEEEAEASTADDTAPAAAVSEAAAVVMTERLWAEEPSAAAAAVRTRVVTNDAMRDHWLNLLPPITFERWRHSQVAAFSCLYEPVDEDGHPIVTPPSDEPSGASDAEDAQAVQAVGETMTTASFTTVAVEDAAAEETHSADDDGIHGYVLRGAWVADPPLLSVEAQAEGRRWHVPVPETEPQEWACIECPE